MTPFQLQEWRSRSGLTHSELASLLGVHRQTVHAWERGRQSVPPYLHLALAELVRLWDEGILRTWYDELELKGSMPKALLPPAKLACPRCDAVHGQVKAGRTRRGSQRYLCRACTRHYTPRPAPSGHPEALREHAVKLYCRKKSTRQVGRELGVSPQSVASWIRESRRGQKLLGSGLYASARR